MSLYTLFTYKNIKELRIIQEELDVTPFVFSETLDILENNTEICIDISSLVYLLRTNKTDLYIAYINLRKINRKCVVIVEESLANSAIELFPFVFHKSEPYLKNEDVCEESSSDTRICCVRQPIYTYNNIDDLSRIIEYANCNNIPIASFSRASKDIHNELEKFNRSAELALVDLTSLSYAIEDNKNLIYVLEQFMNLFPNIKVVSLTSQVDRILQYFPLYFENQEPIIKLIPELVGISQVETDDLIVKITDLNGERYINFIENFNHNLVGHTYFKQKFEYSLKNFISLNKVKEQSVFSVFLFGASGIGKTEVARLIAKGLNENGYLAKINFQNYSSQDSLNSLIGSPAGYVGCNHGELSEKVQKSKVGVILCDEFEKTTRPVFSFFLELLEEGRFTDSMAREYDLDGYVIIFTSNIKDESEYKKTIPIELQTRFDLVCEFEEPTLAEKTKFLDLLLEKAESKYIEKFNQVKMSEEEKEKLYDFDYSNVYSLRDIKRIFNNRLMDFFNEKGV